MSFKNIISPKMAFIICVIVLAGSAIGKRALISKLQIYLRKEPIELKNPLSELDADSLGDYKVVRKSQIENQDILSELGTLSYIIWELEDTSVAENDDARFCSLFVTYYTGINDRIPHVPEECYFGAGNRVKGIVDDTIVLDNNANQQEIEFRQLVFTSKAENIWGAGSEFSVCYLLRVNGQYAGNRTSARNIMAKNLFGKYSYFSKVEWRFRGNYGSANSIKTTQASKKLLEAILPVLEENHWPNIED